MLLLRRRRLDPSINPASRPRGEQPEEWWSLCDILNMPSNHGEVLVMECSLTGPSSPGGTEHTSLLETVNNDDSPAG